MEIYWRVMTTFLDSLLAILFLSSSRKAHLNLIAAPTRFFPLAGFNICASPILAMNIESATM